MDFDDDFQLTPAGFAGSITGPPGATVIIEGSRDLNLSDLWKELARVTLDGSGVATLTDPVEVPAGVERFFLQMRRLP